MKKVFLVLAVVVSLAGCSRSQELTSAPDSDSQSTSATEGFLVRDNDVWVQAGDSITWQALYTTYLEAFIRARYPNLKFVTVNSGKSGEVTIQGVIRFRGSMAAWMSDLR